MIGKISMGASFSGCISYCLEDKRQKQSQEPVFKNRAELIAFNQCFGTKKELIEQFNDVRMLNQKIQKPVMHIVLSLAPGEQLEKGTLVEMASGCARQMGVDKNQYIAVAHIDTNHQHLHIVANRVGCDGRVVSDSNNYKKIAEYCRKMELKYDLKQVLSPRRYLADEKRNIPRMDTRKEKLRENIRECLSTSKNYSEFEAKIRQRGYKIIKGRGILFIDKQAVKVKGSEVGYSLQKIEKILDLKQQLHQVKDDKIKQEQGRKQGDGQHVHVHKQYLQDKSHLGEKESYLNKTLDTLLNPSANNNYVPSELLQQKNGKKKKKRRLHY
jgi:hypothetical protein